VATAPAVTIRHWHPLLALRGRKRKGETALLRVDAGSDDNQSRYVTLRLSERSMRRGFFRTIAAWSDPGPAVPVKEIPPH
jgi:hypothetical protein